MTENLGVDILSLDAKDIYISNNYVHEKGLDSKLGYNIKRKDGSINTKKFINTLDYSLDLIKLREVYEKVYRNTGFTFSQDEHVYTTRIINVTFKYSNKLFNRVRSNVYVKFGYDINLLEFKDYICVIDGELVGIQTDSIVEQPISQSILGKYFYFEDGVYKAKNNIPTLNSVEELRKDLYVNGFYCNGIKYVRFKRSAGSSRVGKCLFIDERMYSRMHKWQKCDIKVKQGEEIDLAAYEAYIALTLSSIVDTIEINPNNILIIDDFDSCFKEDVVETKLNGTWLHTSEATVDMKNSIWDGQSLLDKSLFGEYENKGMLLLRNKFFKSCCFNTNIQQFFKDKGINSIEQLNGFTIATDIKDIKLITTPSSVKYYKFGTPEQWLSTLEPFFGVVKYEKPTHNFDGRMVQSHYQLLNTLQMNEQETREFLQPSLDYLHLLKTDPSALRYYIKYPTEDQCFTTAVETKNDVVYKLLGVTDKFQETKFYDDFKKDIVKSYIKNIRKGHVLIHGNYSTMLGNPLSMLKHSIGEFDGKSELEVGTIHSKNFDYDKVLIGSRSPHVTIGNIWLPKNVRNDEIDTYFNLTNEIVCINSINESVLDRLSGSDFDSDTVLLSDNEYLIRAAQKNYDTFKVCVNHVDSIKRKRAYCPEQQSDLDFKTSDNKIGEIINLSQELNTLLWHEVNNGATYEDIKELYYDVCQLDIMSNLEIDRAKKEFVVDTYSEMKKIKAKWIKTDEDGRTIKPNFFGYIARYKGYYNPAKKNYYRHDTTMDYVEKVINQFQASYRGTNKGKKAYKFESILDESRYNYEQVNYVQVKRVLNLITDARAQEQHIYADTTLDKKEKDKMAFEINQGCIQYIGNIKLNYSTMYYLLASCDSEANANTYRKIINILFGHPNVTFFHIIKESKEPISQLVEQEDGEIQIFDMHFTKQLSE